MRRMRKRCAQFAVVLVAVACAGFVSAGAAGALSPITPANRPTPISGAVNGEVPSNRLVRLSASCAAARQAGPSLMRLFAMAREENIALGADECYRSLAEEVRLANQANQPGNNPACVASVSHAPSGAPVGNSYHGWGKAADLTLAGESLTFGDAGY